MFIRNAEMARCPNCSYVLVALKDSQKCKCARCGRLFFKKGAEGREFRTWNVKQREVDLHNLRIKKARLTPEERKLRARESAKRWVSANLEKCREYREVYREQNKDQIAQRKKVYRQLTKEKANERNRSYRQKRVDRTRLLNQIGYLRIKQAELAYKELGDRTAAGLFTGRNL